MIKTLLTSPQMMIRTLASVSFLLIALALYFEHFMELHPCKMCLWQRTPHYVVIGFGILSMLPLLRPYYRPIITMMGLLLLSGAGIALWHSGVEMNLLSGLSSCSTVMTLDGDASALLDQILAAPAVRCDEVSWSFLGLSMANWNFVITSAMGIGTLICVFKTEALELEKNND